LVFYLSPGAAAAFAPRAANLAAIWRTGGGDMSATWLQSAPLSDADMPDAHAQSATPRAGNSEPARGWRYHTRL
jgi:hypothetical protein